MKGKIEAVSAKVGKNGKTYHSMKVGDTWYGCGLKAPGSKGDTVEFDVEENGDYLNAGNLKTLSGAPPAEQGSSPTTGTDWAKKDAMISFQAARNAANALLAIAVQAGFADAPDTYGKLRQESDKLAKLFFDASSSASFAQPAKPVKAAKDADDSGPEDEIPF